MLLCLRLRFMPLHDGGELLVHDGCRGAVGPVRGEDEELAGLLHVLLVHGPVAALSEHVARKRLSWRRVGRHAGARRQSGPSAGRDAGPARSARSGSHRSHGHPRHWAAVRRATCWRHAGPSGRHSASPRWTAVAAGNAGNAGTAAWAALAGIKASRAAATSHGKVGIC